MQSLVSDGEPYLHLADFNAYVEAQKRVEALYGQPDEWTRKSIANSSRMGPFSSDETIRDYARDIWGVPIG
jgi:starch phosphorylase